MTKQLFFLSFLFLGAFQLSASHTIESRLVVNYYKTDASGKLWYKAVKDILTDPGIVPYVDDSTGIIINTACGYEAIEWLRKVMDSLVPLTVQDCHMLGNSPQLRHTMFSDTFSIPGPCNDVLVIANASGTSYMNIESGSMKGKTTSVRFNAFYNNRSAFLHSTPSLNFGCIQNPFFKNGFFEDKGQGDSLYYEVVEPRKHELPSILPNSYTITVKNTGFTKGFSSSNPLASNQFSIDSQTGHITAHLTAPGVYMIPILVKEYAFDPFLPIVSVELVAEYYEEHVLIVDSNCVTSSSSWKVFDTSQADSAHCSDTSIVVDFNEPVLPRSIDPDGSDFKFFNSQGYPVVIKSAHPVYDNYGWAKAARLDLNFLFAGQYGLRASSGFGSNGLINSCGIQKNSSDTLQLYVSGACANIGLTEGQSSAKPIKLYPNPASNILEVHLPKKNGQLEIIDLFGKHCMTISVTERLQRVNILKLEKGLYFMRFFDGKETSKTVKFLKAD